MPILVTAHEDKFIRVFDIITGAVDAVDTVLPFIDL